MALNPVAFTESVVGDFLRYQLTTYPLADAGLYAQLRELLQVAQTHNTPLRQGPFVSLSRPFKQGASIQQLIDKGIFHPYMGSLVPYPSLRAHQELAIRSIHQRKTTLISTGTGSGKTECFLYPIISRCLELKEQGAPPGIVAVLIYPMNALAEDQLDRLRGLLAGSGIPFGMYVGKTPDKDSNVNGERMLLGTTQAAYRARMKQIREAGQTQSLLPPEERASRESMRANSGQPRILLTNVKQLELLLTRGKDLGMFVDAPLEYLVFDEAHTFRGAQGAETACLIRRLRTFCGREAKEVRHIATSATMADPEGGDAAARDFARRFFGVDGEGVTLVREVYDELRWNELRAVPAAPSKDPQQLLSGLLSAVDLPDEEVPSAISAQVTELGGARLPKKQWQQALASQLVSNELVYQLAEMLEKPRQLSALQRQLSEKIGRDVSEAEILAWLALGAATGRGGYDPLLRPVVHSFVRGVGGAVVTFTGPASSAKLWLAGEDAVAAQGEHAKRFPIITCTTCGQHYYETWVQDFTLLSGKKDIPTGGERKGKRNVWPHIPDATGGNRVLFVDRLVVRADEEGDLEEIDEDGNIEIVSGHEIEHHRLYPMYLCGHCGSLQKEQDGVCLACGTQNQHVEVQVVRSKKDFEGLLHTCVSCRTSGKRPMGSLYREPARPIRAVAVSDVHVLSQSMVHLSERPRLLVFADNRQDAAFQAGWMRDHARRFRLRALMYQQIRQSQGISVGDLASCLDQELEKDLELSSALIPEVWQSEDYEENSTKHRKERRYFLRLQVLRELATSVKQRFGLEPWGRIKITYVGLDEKHEFIQKWSSRLNVSSDVLQEVVAAILDLLRRNRLLSDKTRLFETHWNGGDKEIQNGYFAAFTGGPKGLVLRRTNQLTERVSQWLGVRATQLWNAIKLWGLPEDEIEVFLTDLWEMLCKKKLLIPVQLTGWGKTLKGSLGTFQLDSSKLFLHAHNGRYRCEKCRRTTIRQGPRGLCMAWRCGGRVLWEEESTDDFDLRMLDGNYAMLRVAEHSAQVPHERREQIENQFKGEGEQLNVLVCTPTLELGVDIGSLDAVLMRNVPPTAANYWQRAGRAGRRHRMAVDITYAQATGFDQAYFRDPLKLLQGQVEPPRFNLKNQVMIRKHVHASALTALYRMAKLGSQKTKETIEGILSQCFPPLLRGYLFDAKGEILGKPFDTSILETLIQQKKEPILASVERIFQESWPQEDAASVAQSFLERCLDEMAKCLQEVILRFKRRLDWALTEQSRLHAIAKKKGDLDLEDEAHRKRCARVIARLKGTISRRIGRAEGGQDDPETMGALAREGFLPGYGLEAGSFVGMAEPPRMSQGVGNFELPRSPVLALREHVPGNAIYANGFRFVPRRFLLLPEEVLRFRISISKQTVQEVGVHRESAKLAAQEIRAVPTCDVIMPSQSHISDEEEFRFQMPVSIYGKDRGYHHGGQAWTWGNLDLRFRRGVHLRLVNVGPRSEVSGARLGFPLCLACGQSQSPFASKKSREEFEKQHLDRCKHKVESTGFFADVEVDVLGFHDVEDRKIGLSLAESMRMGAARVLDMEIEDLQILVLGHETEDRCDVFLYDPMAGGSGLLEYLAERWEEVREAALDIAEHCPSACESSCIDCLRTYRNRFYHEYLDRSVAIEVLRSSSGPLLEVYPIPENLPKTSSTTGQGQTWIENRFKRFLKEAGLPDPMCQYPLDLGTGYGATIPDFFYELADEDEEGICIYLDGMANHIHGNPEQAEKDRTIRERLRSLDYEVVEIRSFELDDRKAVVQAITRIAKKLVGKAKQKELKENTDWFERGQAEPDSESEAKPKLLLIEGKKSKKTPPEDDSSSFPPFRIVNPTEPEKYKRCIPVIPLEIAAGQFSGSQEASEQDWVWVELDEQKERSPDLFVARVVGESMNRRIPNGSWCLWRFHPRGSRQGKVVLCQHRSISDPEHGGSYTVKIYHSKKKEDKKEGWRHEEITLSPDSDDPSFQPICLKASQENEFTIIAELIEILWRSDDNR